MALAVPRSFDDPVPASQARSKAQEILDANREQAERLFAGREAKRRLVRMLRDADAALYKRLASIQVGADGSRAWTYLDVEATLAQVRQQLALVDPQMRAMLDANSRRALDLGARETVQILERFEGVAPGSVRPLSLDAASALSRGTVLAQHATSVARYGAQVIASVQRELVAGVLVNRTFDEMTTSLRRSEPLLSRRYLAERVVRTECMAAYSEGHMEEMRAQKADAFPDLKKKLIETFDKRTAWDSYDAHGEVRELDGLFVDGKGRRYLRPPGRPNDRAVVIPWRDAWSEPRAARATAVEMPKPEQPKVTVEPAIKAQSKPSVTPPTPPKLIAEPFKPSLLSSPTVAEDKAARALSSSVRKIASKAEIDAVETFTSAGYKAMRAVDRGGPPDQLPTGRLLAAYQAKVDALTALLDRAPMHVGTVYRGMYQLTPEALAVLRGDSHIVMDAFGSSTRDYKVAHGFATTWVEKERAAVLVLKQRSGVAIETISTSPEEKEVMLKKGSRYRILGRYERDGILHVEAEET